MLAAERDNTIFCPDEYGKAVQLVLLSLVVAGAILASSFMTWKFSRKIQLFPLKGRGPRLALIQMTYFVLLNLIPVTVEVLVASGISWEDDKKSHFSQDFLKGLYFTVRISCYLIVVLRTVLVYANWKIPLEVLLAPVWRVLGQEMKIILFLFAGQLALLVLSCVFADYYYTGFPSLDTYKESHQIGYKVFNLTYLAIAENALLLGCYYVLR